MTANGVTYKYPSSWQPQDGLTTGAQQGNRVWQQAVGTDSTNLAILSQYDLGQEVTAENVEQLQADVTTTLEGLATQAGGKTTSPVTLETTAGYPGFTQTLTVQRPTGEQVDSTIWLFFNGKTEYFLNCQYVSAQQTETLAGCNTIRTTFAVTP